MGKGALALGLVVAGIAGLALAGLHLSLAVAVLVGVCAVLGAVTFFGVGTDDLALFAVGLLSLTSTWNGIRLGGPSASSSSGVGGGAFGDATMALAFVAVAADALGRKRALPMPPWLLLAGLGMFAAFVVTMIFPPSIHLLDLSGLAQATLAQQDGITGPLGSLGLSTDTLTLIEFELALVLIPIMLATVAITQRRCRLMMDLWVAGAVINGGVGLLDYMGIHVGPSPISQNRSAGLTIHPNYLALTCVIALPMAMVWFGRSRRWNVAAVIAVASLVGGVLASGSRAGFAAAGVAALLTVLIVPKLRRALPYVLPLVGIVLIVVLLFTSAGHKLLVQLRLAHSSSTSTSGSNYQRSLVANVAWTQIKARPFSGVGWSVVTGAHDIYLELLDAGGVIAMTAFLVFVGGMVSSLRKALSGPLRDEAIVCALGILAWLINGTFDNQVADKYLYLVPGLLLAIARASSLRHPQPAQPEHASRLRVQPAASRALAGVSGG
jgi:O-antigen ligase